MAPSIHRHSRFTVMATEAGMLSRRTLGRNFPRIRSLLGSSARMKEGMPMVRELISVCWMGWKG